MSSKMSDETGVTSVSPTIALNSLLDADSTVGSGRYKVDRSGNGFAGRIPKMDAVRLGLSEIGQTEVFVNYELGVVIHKIPDLEADE